MLTVCGAGFVPPCVALKAMLEGLSAMAGAGGLTTRVTVTVCGLLLATLDARGTVAVYVPATRLPVVTVSVSVAGAVVPLSPAPSQPVGCPAP
jgi:hypothetical protein